VIKLVRAEMRRVLARRLVRLTALLALLGIAGGGILAFATSSSMSEATYQQRARDAHARQQAQEERIQACLRRHGVNDPRAQISGEIERACLPKQNELISAKDPRFHRTRLKGVLQGVSGVLAIVGWALGASLVGAEFASRGMTTLLTWEPRRVRVFTAKTIAVIVSAAVFTVVSLALVALAMAPSLVAHGAPMRAIDPGAATLAGIVGRGTALAALAAMMGFAIATVGRNTAAALGAGFGYIVVLENIVGGAVPRWRRWLLLGNVIVFVSGSSSGNDVPGRTVAAAGVFLAVVAVTLLAGAGSAFRVRDIA
jgi:ABC-2 type transport system permease protein